MFGNTFGLSYGELTRLAGQIVFLNATTASTSLDNIQVKILGKLKVDNLSAGTSISPLAVKTSKPITLQNLQTNTSLDSIRVALEVNVELDDLSAKTVTDLIDVINWTKLGKDFGVGKNAYVDYGEIGLANKDNGVIKNAYGESGRFDSIGDLLITEDGEFIIISEDGYPLVSQLSSTKTNRLIEAYKFGGRL